MSWRCDICGHTWRIPVSLCVRCKCAVQEVAQGNVEVKGHTTVHARSLEHQDTPYHVLLLEDSAGNFSLKKSVALYEIGHVLGQHTESHELPVVGVAGTGVTGVGIAQMALLAGCRVILMGRSDNSLDKAYAKIEKGLSKRMEATALVESMSRMERTTSLEAMKRADVVIESVVEDVEVKRNVFSKLDAICPPSTVLASNTSSLSIDLIASATNNPERVAGMHFFNPVHKMRLVEIVQGAKTSAPTIEAVRALARIFSKTGVLVKDKPGFIVNRLLMSFLTKAVEVLEEDLATPEDIDIAIELGLNHPMGPLKLLDLIGIDVFDDIIETLHSFNPEQFHALEIIKTMRARNALGQKTGMGFYRYQ